jgi:diketogulonate reductase-like aldo/keto reductase
MTTATLTLRDGARMPALGLGTWRMGERARDRAAEVAALKRGLDAGLALIDTAEMYGEGGAEEVVGEALRGRRDDVFIVSKVYPHNAGRRAAVAACERSLARLKTDRLDLYLLHWRGDVPLAETVEAFEKLKRDGRILRWGVSNFDVADLDDLERVPGGETCVANQVLYHLAQRGIEAGALERGRASGIVTMAYSPFDQGRLLRHAGLRRIAEGAGVSPATLALAWLLAQRDVVVIPKAVVPAHVDAIVAARELQLTRDVADALERAFPRPLRPTPLAML